MCGRFALFSDLPRVARRLGLPEPEAQWQPRYNVSPGTWITGVRRSDPDVDAHFDSPWWGYRPHWAGQSGPEPINARAERLDSSRYFRGAFHRHRCLIPADGWYEWLPGEDGKQPYFFAREDREPLFLGAIWEPYADDTACCAIITEPARGIAREIHDRMPLVLDDQSLEAWLNPDLGERDAIRAAVHHLEAAALTAWPVSTRVNRSDQEGAGLMEPLAP
ncbi:Putative SOS response-associated peptidase YedK [Halomonas sp. THAF5a]|uniref:SOS response-associated peptidase n=1 Tax=Halomonas sp. THAF5a TaxID=2587844 RepID=UPI0012686772|nr:SOS response-associated peptidase [Halomonas sp. THAF5a]QFU00981.1 Putative SOS response-associated peptidase YedK [Halomonas sp. THAF5a]